MGRWADIFRGVVEDEVFEMYEFAVAPEGCACVGEILPSEEARSDRRAGNALVKARHASGVDSRPNQDAHAYFREI